MYDISTYGFDFSIFFRSGHVVLRDVDASSGSNAPTVVGNMFIATTQKTTALIIQKRILVLIYLKF